MVDTINNIGIIWIFTNLYPLICIKWIWNYKYTNFNRLIIIKLIQNGKKVPFSGYFYHFYLSFLLFQMAFIEPFLSSLNKWIIGYHSKRYGPFIDFCRSLPRTPKMKKNLFRTIVTKRKTIKELFQTNCFPTFKHC